MRKTITFQLKDTTILHQFQTDLKNIKANYREKTIKDKKIAFEVILSQSVEEFLSEFKNTESYRYIEGNPDLLTFVETIKEGSVIWSKSNLDLLLKNFKDAKRNIQIEKGNAKLVRMIDEKKVEIQPILLPDYDLKEYHPNLEKIFKSTNYRPTQKDLSAINWMKETYGEYPRFRKRKNQFILEKGNLRLKIGKADPRVILSALKNNETYGVIPNQNTAYPILYLIKPTKGLVDYYHEKDSIKKLFLSSIEEARWSEIKQIRKGMIKLYRDVPRFALGDIVEWTDQQGEIQKGMFDYESSTIEKAFEKYKRLKELPGPRTDEDGRKHFTAWKGCLMEGEGPYVVLHKTLVSKKTLNFEFFAIPKEEANLAQRMDYNEIKEMVHYFHKQKGLITKRVTTRNTDEVYSNAFYFTENDLIIYYPNAIVHSASRNYMEDDITLEETINLIGANMSGKASEKAKKLYFEILDYSQEKNKLLNQLPPTSVNHTEKDLVTIEVLLNVTRELYKRSSYYEYVTWEEGRKYLDEHLLYLYDLQCYRYYLAAINKQEEEFNQLNLARNIIKAQVYERAK